MGRPMVARWAWRRVVYQEIVQEVVPTGDGRTLSDCLEWTVTGRVGRTSVFGQRTRAAYMVMLGKDIESRCPPLWNTVVSCAGHTDYR